MTDDRRATSSLVGVMLLVGVTVVVGVALTFGALTFLPAGDDPGVRPDADFSIERDDGDVVVDPQYMSEDTPFTLLINGREVYEWGGANTEREEMSESFELDGSDVRVTAGGVEPTNDVYMMFEPGCSESRFKFLRMQGGYNNQILLDGSELFRTDSASAGQVYTGLGVDCT